MYITRCSESLSISAGCIEISSDREQYYLLLEIVGLDSSRKHGPKSGQDRSAEVRPDGCRATAVDRSACNSSFLCNRGADSSKSLIGGLQNAQERIEQLDSDLEKQAASEKHWYKEMRSLKEQIDEQRRLEVSQSKAQSAYSTIGHMAVSTVADPTSGQVQVCSVADRWRQLPGESSSRIFARSTNHLRQFKKEHLSAGDQGGRRAATLLRDGIAKQCNVPADSKIIVRLFINWEGLIGFLLKKAWISHRQMFAEFVAGFRRAAEYMDIIDTGSNKDAADIKLLGNISFPLQRSSAP